MANPSGRTYHFSQHRPASQGEGPRFAYREHPLPPEYTTGRVQQPISQSSALQRSWLGVVSGEVGTLAQRYPILALCASVAAGFLVTRKVWRHL